MLDQQSEEARPGSPQKRRRISKPATAAQLEKTALAHINRYATSAANLRNVLLRRVERSVRLHGTDRSEATGWVGEIIAQLLEQRLLDDTAYARGRANSLHRSGASRRKITSILQQKGVGRDDVDAALAALAAKYEDSDIVAACNYARRRRLGPRRLPEAREEFRERDLAVLARAGFGYVAARRVIEAQSVEDLETNVLA